jgi:hypothetical protein
MARADESRIAIDVDLNGWKLEQLTYVALIVKVPLVPNEKIPNLPNPVRPFAAKAQNEKTNGLRTLDVRKRHAHY